MIQFNECRITSDNSKLIIDVSVIDSEYYENIGISDIIIDNQDTFVDSGPSSNPVFHYTATPTIVTTPTTENLPSESDLESDLEEVSEELDITDDKDIINDEDIIDEDAILKKIYPKDIRLVLTEADLSNEQIEALLNGNLLFIYAKAAGTPAANTPCGMDNTFSLAVVYNKYFVAYKGLQLLYYEPISCEVPVSILDYLLKKEALNIAIATANYTKAIHNWNRYFKTDITKLPSKNCKICRNS